MLVSYLMGNGLDVKLVRIRSGRTAASILYKFFAKTKPCLIERGGDGRLIRLNFLKSRLDKEIWSWIEFFSMLPWIIRGVCIPLHMGKIVVAERYIIDALVTIGYITNSPEWMNGFLARLMVRLIPRYSFLIHIDAPYITIRNRKGDNVDPIEYIEFQRKAYLSFAKTMKSFSIDTSNLSKEETHVTICKYLKAICNRNH